MIQASVYLVLGCSGRLKDLLNRLFIVLVLSPTLLIAATDVTQGCNTDNSCIPKARWLSGRCGKGGIGLSYSQMNFTASFPDTPMLEDGEEGGLRLWHLVKPTEEPEATKQQQGRRSSLRERAKAIPEIYLTRLLSMKVRDKHGVFEMLFPSHPI